ncbi:hypothetical protein GPECTOR_50g593 [Gonium pectorale]|uniref:EF-hand domain-containing protein n=1 Tax=Gonium pectorale TaxID=33097 RepID=A0A150G7F7_GONPE|nr:hypothetical protein GPECTOR_50g593 [Gonium pectorale]|eukprot:KXZ45799.1 hypothetical protein GPECTOR_50g593 [Gonium pectorale]
MDRAGSSSAADLVLEPLTWQGRSYRLDRRTSAVYAESGDDGYPELVGKWQDGNVVLRGQNVLSDLFHNLDKHLAENKAQFADLFASFDTDGTGALEVPEIERLVHQLIPGASDPEVKYVMAMLDFSGDGAVTQEEFLEAVRQMLANRARSPKLQARHGAVISAVGAYLRSGSEDAQALFARFDTDGNGRLDPSELSWFFAAAVPKLEEAERKFLLSHMFAMDANGDGTVSYPELLYAMRAAGTASRSSSKATKAQDWLLRAQQSLVSEAPAEEAEAPSHPVSLSEDAEVILEELVWEGRTYALDRRRGAVYSGSSTHGYPELVGRWQAQFADLFESFDTGGTGALQVAVLERLVHQLIPGASDPEVKYVMAVLDLSEAGSVTQAEFLASVSGALAHRSSGPEVQVSRRAAQPWGGANARLRIDSAPSFCPLTTLAHP